MNSENITKVLDDLKNRFASRFMFSFTIARLIYNWQITVALFWYDKSQFQAEGCKSIFEFISNQLKDNPDTVRAFWSAVIYTFGLPISKSLINIWDELILDFRNRSKTKLIRNQDAKIIKDLNNKLKNVSDNSLLNGVWMYHQNIHETDNPQQVFFKNGDWYFIKNDKYEREYSLENYHFNPNNNKLFFYIKYTSYLGTKTVLFNLNYSIDSLEGTSYDLSDNIVSDIAFRRFVKNNDILIKKNIIVRVFQFFKKCKI